MSWWAWPELFGHAASEPRIPRSNINDDPIIKEGTAKHEQ